MFTIRIIKNENVLEEYQEYLKANYLCAGDEYKVYAVDSNKFLINLGGAFWKWISSDICEPVKD